MVSAQGRVIVAPVEDASVAAVLEPRQGDGSANHVLKETLEFSSFALGDAAIARDIKTRMPPGPQELDPLGGDLLLQQEKLEQFLAEEVLQRGEVDVLGDGVEDRIAGEETERGARRCAGVGVDLASQGRRVGHHLRPDLIEVVH